MNAARVATGSLPPVLAEWDLRLEKSLSSLEFTDRDHKCVALADAAGSILACSRPGLTANAEAIAASVARAFPDLDVDEAVATNDPYSGSPHVQDHWIAVPVHRAGDSAGLVLVAAHLADVGGGAFGNYYPLATDLWQEGVLTTPVRLARRGRIDRDVLELLKLNSRVPLLVEHDLRAMYEAGRHIAGEAELHLADASGADLLGESDRIVVERIVSQVTARLGPLIGRVHNCAGADATIAVSVSREGDLLRVSLEGTSPQVEAGAINLTLHNTRSAVAAVLARLSSAPASSGLFRHVEVIAPEFSLVNCSYPLPVGCSTDHPSRVLIGLLEEALGTWVTPIGAARVFETRRPVVRIDGCRREGCPF
jgi:N-methylhydantoinase B